MQAHNTSECEWNDDHHLTHWVRILAIHQKDVSYTDDLVSQFPYLGIRERAKYSATESLLAILLVRAEENSIFQNECLRSRTEVITRLRALLSPERPTLQYALQIQAESKARQYDPFLLKAIRPLPHEGSNNFAATVTSGSISIPPLSSSHEILVNTFLCICRCCSQQNHSGCCIRRSHCTYECGALFFCI